MTFSGCVYPVIWFENTDDVAGSHEHELCYDSFLGLPGLNNSISSIVSIAKVNERDLVLAEAHHLLDKHR